MSNELEAVEMLGFTRVGASSLPNVYALLTGLDSKQLRGKPFFRWVPLSFGRITRSSGIGPYSEKKVLLLRMRSSTTRVDSEQLQLTSISVH